MATIIAYTGFSKRKNSTKQPTGGTTITATLKDDVSMVQPVFVVQGNTFTYNYIEFAGRYYYIDDVVSLRNNLTEIHCNIDVLATYKAAIQASSQYVNYYTHANTQIVDQRLSTKTDISVSSDTETFINLGSGESYLLTCVGKDKTTIFSCSKSDVDELFTDTFLNTIQTGYETEVNNLASAISSAALLDVEDAIRHWWLWQIDALKIASKTTNTAVYSSEAPSYVKNCYVLPIAQANIGGSSHSIKLGAWESNSSGNMGFPRIVHDSATLSIPWQATDWRRNAPYHEIYLYIPYVGLITISPSEVIGVTNITVNVSIDTYSGVTSFVVNASNGSVLGQYSTNIAAPYAVGSSNIDIVASGAQIIASAASIAAGAVSGNVPAVAMGALGLTNAIRPMDASISSNGGAAGMGLGNTVKCFTIYHDTTVAPSSVSAVKGTPYNGVMSLAGVSGYVQTSGASVDIAGYGNEKDMVNNYLNGGIYIE